MKRISEKEIRIMITYHYNGMSNAEIARKMHRDKDTVGRNLKNNGCNTRKYYSSIEIEEIKHLYIDKNMNAHEIGKYLPNRSWESIQHLIKRRGWSRGQGRGRYSKTNDHDYFKEINTSEKAYVLGYIAADGSVSSKKNVRLECVKNDVEIVEFVKNQINPAAEIKYHDRGQRGIFAYCYVGSIDNVNDLAKYNILPLKQCQNFDFPEIPSKYYPDYIRGYFDGDGTSWTTKKRYFVSICCDEKFAHSLERILKSSGIITKEKNNIIDMRKYNDNIFHLRITRQEDVKRFFEYIYYSENVFCLKRKKEKLKQIY